MYRYAIALLLATATPAIAGELPASCADDPWLRTKECREAWKKNQHWEVIRADNGAIYQIDTGNLNRTPPIVVTVWAQEGSYQRPTDMVFGCDGYFTIIADDHGRVAPSPQYAPPNSVAGRIEALVCHK